ncbi:hypothetical protein CEXT_542411 [Caerostris extrusa]|uniref:Uncharacterized protein n=1 Tax=Caerostris extrusa TaxID=172846 RepID=A0AAV4NNP1_CAEEX|nr:hypothetical protein CEXT_542411 [Caerostris extrusa]
MKRNIRMRSGWRKVIEKPPPELVIQEENQRVGRIKGESIREGLLWESSMPDIILELNEQKKAMQQQPAKESF